MSFEKPWIYTNGLLLNTTIELSRAGTGLLFFTGDPIAYRINYLSKTT